MNTHLLLKTGIALSLLSCIAGNAIEREKKELNVSVGDEFSLSLPANPSTGYVWAMLVNQPPEKRWIELTKSEFTGGKTARPGAGGTITFTFKAVTPTDSTSYGVPLYYCRPASGEIAKILSLILTISPQEK